LSTSSTSVGRGDISHFGEARQRQRPSLAFGGAGERTRVRKGVEERGDQGKKGQSVGLGAADPTDGLLLLVEGGKARPEEESSCYGPA